VDEIRQAMVADESNQWISGALMTSSPLDLSDEEEFSSC
jgi:hypothetical protein